MRPAVIAAAFLLAASTLLASADLKIAVVNESSRIRAGLPYGGLQFLVRNDGPDIATSVKLTITAPVAFTCNCDQIGSLGAGESRLGFLNFTAPDTPLTFTVTGTVTSAVPDPNPADNTASQTFIVSAAPDVMLFLNAFPLTQDLALPFSLSASLRNLSNTTAHDVDVTIDFSPDIGVRKLPAACSNPAPGQIVCHLDSLPPTGSDFPTFAMTLVAPESYGSGKMVFAGHARESEEDFDPSSNDATATVALYQTAYVTSTANSGLGSLRDAINSLPTLCALNVPCTIAFRIAEPSATPWKTIRITSPLPPIGTPHVRIEGATQTAFFGDTNPDGPEIEISGGVAVDGDGLVIGCGQISNLVINGFRGNGVSVAQSAFPQCGGGDLHGLYVGTDPTGTQARPNGRGIGTSDNFGTTISGCVISGNTRSGIFAWNGALKLQFNRIGVQAHADLPLPNGNAGVYVGTGGYGSDIGAGVFETGIPPLGRYANVIAFNGQMGIAVAAGVDNVSIRDNRIWGNGGLGIDIGLDGPSPGGSVPAPVLTQAHFDPAANKTIIEGDVARPSGVVSNIEIDFYASDAPALSGAGEAQRPLGTIGTKPGHFQFEADGDLTGQFVTATSTRVDFEGFDNVVANGTEQGFLTRTSEISRPIEVR